MPEPCLLDNDIVLKIAAFQLGEAVLPMLTINDERPAILGVGRFVVTRKAERVGRFQYSAAVAASAGALLAQLGVVEPNEDEIELAAEFETAALQEGVEFDTGEAQLLAMLLHRSCPAIVTGDKRAVVAMSKLADVQVHAPGMVICLEQLLAQVVSGHPIEALRTLICSEPNADTATSMCFACATIDATELDREDVTSALQSYVADLRRKSGDVLMADEKMSALAS